MQTVVIGLILWTFVPAGFFYCLPCISKMVRACIRHKRDKAASNALRDMRYNDIRRSR